MPILHRTLHEDVSPEVRRNMLRAIVTTPLSAAGWVATDPRKPGVHILLAAAYGARGMSVPANFLERFPTDDAVISHIAQMLKISPALVRQCDIEWRCLHRGPRKEFIAECYRNLRKANVIKRHRERARKNRAHKRYLVRRRHHPQMFLVRH